MRKVCIQAHPTLTKTLKQKQNRVFNLGRLPKQNFNVFFIAISKTTRARMMKFLIQALPCSAIRSKPNKHCQKIFNNRFACNRTYEKYIIS